MQVNFIRHGQSRGNVGLPCENMAGIPLTDFGHEQARVLAERWTQKPTLILVSPYLRTQETAAPTIARFPDVPVEEWQIHEFNNLHPDRWQGDHQAKWVEEDRQWTACDPDYCDGGGAESFRALHDRALDALDRLTKLPADSLVYTFSHGYFMQAVRLSLTHPDLTASDRMRMFRPEDGSPPFENTDVFPIEWNGSNWRMLQASSQPRSA